MGIHADRRTFRGVHSYAALLARLRAGAEPKTVASELLGQPDLLAIERRAQDDSQRQIGRIWRIALEHFELLLAIVSGLAVAWADEVDVPAKIRDGDVRLEAVWRLARRGIQAAHEVLWMLEGGYPGAAMARWRTMHEIATFALVLSKQSPILSRRFLDHQWIEAQRAIDAMPDGMRQAEPAMSAYEEQVQDEVARVRAAHPDKAFTRVNGWMAPFEPSCRFSDLQKHVSTELTPMVYLYGNAHTHAGHVQPSIQLGIAPQWGDVQPIGPSAVDLDQVGVYAPNTIMAFALALLSIEAMQTGAELISAIHHLQCTTSQIFAEIGEVISQVNSEAAFSGPAPTETTD
jgi:hypothetical protein